MVHIRSVLGYLVAFLSIGLTIATYACNGLVGKEFVKFAKLVVSPNMYGGEIIKSIQRSGYRVVIHEPLFNGLLKPRRIGSVQVDFFIENSSPIVIDESLDFDQDEQMDCKVHYDAEFNQVELESFNPRILTEYRGIKRKSGYTINIRVINPDYDGYNN